MHELFFQPLDHLFETLMCVVGFEVVGAELLDHAGKILGQHVETKVAFHRSGSRILGAPFITRCFSRLHRLFDRMTFFVDNVA